MDSKQEHFEKAKTWFGDNFVTPFIQGLCFGTSHLLVLTVLVKYFGGNK